jgi:hypothetical protein
MLDSQDSCCPLFFSFSSPEGLNNKIRVIQRRAFGYRAEEYLRLKILTAFLPQKWTEITHTSLH